VELIRGILDGVEGGDLEAIREILPALVREVCDPEVEFVETPERVDARTYYGHDGVLEAFNRWLDQWDEYDAETESFEDQWRRRLRRGPRTGPRAQRADGGSSAVPDFSRCATGRSCATASTTTSPQPAPRSQPATRASSRLRREASLP
jgi:hypothetical protein